MGMTSLNEDHPGEIIASSKSSMKASVVARTRVPRPSHTLTPESGAPLLLPLVLPLPLLVLPLVLPLPPLLLPLLLPLVLPLPLLLLPELLPLVLPLPASGDAEPEEQARLEPSPATSNEISAALWVVREVMCRIVTTPGFD
jgi:hypothetical protein